MSPEIAELTKLGHLQLIRSSDCIELDAGSTR